MRPAHDRKRDGMTLIEVIIATAIFLISFVAIYSLVNMGSNMSRETAWGSTAGRLAESKMAEVVAGAVPITGGEGQSVEEPEWNWSIASTEHELVPDLWRVDVRVWRQFGTAQPYEYTLSRLVLDPLVRTQPIPPPLPEDELLDGGTVPAM